VTVTVTPDAFQYVSFHAARIAEVAERTAAMVGLDGHDVHIEVDETTPLARIRTTIDGGAITVAIESGALEDTRRPRQFSDDAAALAIGRALIKAADRLHGGFAAAPPDDELSLPQVAAWDVYAVGRLARQGIATNAQRWRYNFRNRHGFDDAADARFDRLWNSDRLTWDDL
jgi:hypothetical protein